MKGIGLYDTDFPVIKEDKDLVMENVKRILTTLPGENVGNLEFGCRLREFIFDFENVLLEDLEQIIIAAITKWEPRVIIFETSVKTDPEMKTHMNVILSLALREDYEKFNVEIPILF